MKTCIGCQEEKPLRDFYKNHLGYYQSRCKPCNTKQVTEYRRQKSKDPEWRKERKKKQADWRSSKRNDPEFRAARIRENMLQRSRKANLGPVEFTKEDILQKIYGRCAVSGIPFELTEYGNPGPWTPTPDRLDTSRGYTKDNVQWVCLMFNRMRGSDSLDDVRKFVMSAYVMMEDGAF